MIDLSIQSNFVPPISISTVLLSPMLLIAVFTDMKSHRIPNLVSFGGLLAGIALQVYLSGIGGLWIALGGMLTGMLIFLVLYIAGGMAAGDVKLMAAAGAFLGPVDALMAALMSLVFGGILGLLVLIPHKRGRETFRRYFEMIKFFFVTGKLSYLPVQAEEAAATRFPYALAIAAGTWTVHFGLMA